MSAHTPGPWHVMPQVDPSRLDIQEKDDAGYAVASAWGGGNVMEEAMQSNARLIAAAPRMLDLLKRVVAIADGKAVDRLMEDDARAILRDVEGNNEQS